MWMEFQSKSKRQFCDTLFQLPARFKVSAPKPSFATAKRVSHFKKGFREIFKEGKAKKVLWLRLFQIILSEIITGIENFHLNG